MGFLIQLIGIDHIIKINYQNNYMIISRTPFRVSFFGGGTDYPVWYRENKGSVISPLINKFCYVTLGFYLNFLNINTA